jgi:hypothetical protein
MKKQFFNLGLAVVVLVFAFTAAFPLRASAASGGITESITAKELAAVRQATVKYHDVSVAEADGFVAVSHCTLNADGTAGMGIHYGNIARLMDPAINLLEPELLLYEPSGDGLKLVAVEYMFAIGPPDSPIPANPPPAPELLGRVFDGPMLGHEPGMPPHYDFHVWLWKANPNGIFTPFNPNVNCP